METISIVIPVYNSARYLSACLDSVINQTYPDLDIILVEDGSTDDSLDICTTYALRDNRVNLIQGVHQGVGAARNCGIRAAKGNYIVFVDSDDICEPTLVERLTKAQNNQPKTLTLCGIQVTDESNNPSETFQEASRTCDTKTYVSEILNKWKTNPIVGGVYCKLFDTSILKENNLLFEEDATYAEDFVFNMQYLRHIEKVSILPDLLYRYRCGRSGSLTEQNLKEAEFTALWQRRQAVTQIYEDTFTAYNLQDQNAEDIAAFRAFQLTDMIQLAARRADTYNDFQKSMAALRNGQKEKEIPTGIPPKDQKTIQLLYDNKLQALWRYERLRRRIRILRGREKW